MVEGRDTEKITTGAFFTSDGNAKDEDGGYYFRRADKAKIEGREALPQRIKNSPFQRTADTFRKNKLMRNTAICAVAALVIWGVASSNTPAGQQASDSIKGVIDYQTNLERDLGDLKFVDSALEEDAIRVSSDDAQTQASPSAGPEDKTADTSASAKVADAGQTADGAKAAASASAGKDSNFIYPLDGIVTTTFAQSGSGVIITATDSTDVKTSKAGKVSAVSENYLSIQNQDSSVSTYYGVAASVKKGDTVAAGQNIGKLLSQTLYVEQDLKGEKTDPLS